MLARIGLLTNTSIIHRIHDAGTRPGSTVNDRRISAQLDTNENVSPSAVEVLRRNVRRKLRFKKGNLVFQ